MKPLILVKRGLELTKKESRFIHKHRVVGVGDHCCRAYNLIKKHEVVTLFEIAVNQTQTLSTPLQQTMRLAPHVLSRSKRNTSEATAGASSFIN